MCVESEIVFFQYLLYTYSFPVQEIQRFWLQQQGVASCLFFSIYLYLVYVMIRKNVLLST